MAVDRSPQKLQAVVVVVVVVDCQLTEDQKAASGGEEVDVFLSK